MIRQIGIAVVAIALGLQSAAGANFCTTNGTELVAALAAAKINGQPDVIRLASGFYVHPSAGTFSFSPAIGENHAIEISGGWSEFFGNACGQQLAADHAFSTVLLANGAVRVMNIEPPANSSMDVTVKRLTFLGGDSGGEGSGLRIYPFSGYSGRIVVENSVFLQNSGTNGAALRILSPDVVYLRNSLFQSNHSTGFSVVYVETFGADGRTYITNNTVVGNTTTHTDASSSSGVDARIGSGAQAFVANNNLWNNDGFDLRLPGSGNHVLRNNNIGTVNGIADTSSGNMSIEPVYIGGGGDFTPAPGSPLIDAGLRPPQIVPIPPRFEDQWSLGTADVLQRTREQGSRVDIGAYEARPTAVFRNGFE